MGVKVLRTTYPAENQTIDTGGWWPILAPKKFSFIRFRYRKKGHFTDVTLSSLDCRYSFKLPQVRLPQKGMQVPIHQKRRHSTSRPRDSDYCATKFTIGCVLSVSASTIRLISARRISLYCCQLICPDA